VTHLVIGDAAPDFQLSDQHGDLHTLSSFRGKQIILYFYPKDNTPGCTAQSCNLAENYSLFISKGIQTVGVSNDSEKSHLKFAKKYKLPFILLADTDKKMVTDYGVYGEKVLFGKKYNGIHRTTFIIDPEGIITDVLTDIDTRDHSTQIINKLN
jgi:thioredoxin-dependent peroxiredoxin